MRKIWFSFFCLVFGSHVWANTSANAGSPILKPSIGPVPAKVQKDTVKTEEIPPEREADYQALKKRVLARWDQFIARRLDLVYLFETPAYRSTHSLAMFYNNYGSLVTWKSARVKYIHFDTKDPDLAEVGVIFVGSYANPFGEGVINSERFTKETWRKIDGEWYYVRK